MLGLSKTMKQSLKAIAVVLVAFTAVACTGGPTGPTTTASTSTTGSTSSTTIDDDCDEYLPTAVGLSTSTAAAGDTITVSGNGVEGRTVIITLRNVDDNTVEDPGVSTPVGPGGSWSTSVTLPDPMAAGDWNVIATDSGCTGEATALITIS